MQKTIILLLLFSLSVQAQNLKLMSYNIRFDNPLDGDNKWDLRKSFLAEQIQFYEPDIFGIQEGKLHQIQYLDSILTDFKYIGKGRDSSQTGGEYSALFYNDKKYKVVKQATFWLSETPDVVSKGWDAMLERICTYALFENQITKQRLYIFNTHFDHVGETARTKSAKLLIDKIATINSEKLPFVLMGDFNSQADSNAYLLLSNSYNDAKISSQSPAFGPSGTFNNFEFHKPVTLRIDYIFTSKDNIEVLKYAVLSDSKNCKYPSDHLPVYAAISMKN
jgi:endonuclease/exonuclease/phosphatase family metal-dependent hydrolase